MADITPVALDFTLTARTFAAVASGGDKIVQPGGTRRMLVVFKNTAAGVRTVTITAQDTSPTLAGYGIVAVEDKVLALADGSSTPTYGYVEIPKSGFNNGSDSDKVAVTYSDSGAGILLVAFYLPA